MQPVDFSFVVCMCLFSVITTLDCKTNMGAHPWKLILILTCRFLIGSRTPHVSMSIDIAIVLLLFMKTFLEESVFYRILHDILAQIIFLPPCLYCSLSHRYRICDVDVCIVAGLPQSVDSALCPFVVLSDSLHLL